MNDTAPHALVADDYALIRMDVCDILGDAGFRCYQAATAEEALEVLGEHSADIRLLFSDVQMPPGKLTGFDLAWQCSRSWPDIGILIASGGLMPGPGDMPPGGMFIFKPFSPAIIHKHLKMVLPDGEQPEQLQRRI